MTNDNLKKLFSTGEYANLSDAERQVVTEILQEMTKSGKSQILDSIYYQDYDEIPVDFDTFLRDDQYLGRSTRHGEFLYPFWRKEDAKIMSMTDINEVALSGSIGTGKSTNAVLMMAYHLYRLMCMKDPQSFFGLSPGSEITYAFLNNTLDSSYGVGFKTLQAFLQESPWFLKHGKISGRTDPTYYPEKGFGFIVGSKPQHTLGRHIVCLTGDTEIYTSTGIEKIEDLVGKTIKVLSYDDDKGIIVSDYCTVQVTGEVNELIEIELEDGSMIKCTPDHRLMLSDGSYKMAKDLTESDKLMEVNRI